MIRPPERAGISLLISIRAGATRPPLPDDLSAAALVKAVAGAGGDPAMLLAIIGLVGGPDFSRTDRRRSARMLRQLETGASRGFRSATNKSISCEVTSVAKLTGQYLVNDTFHPSWLKSSIAHLRDEQVSKVS